MRWGRWAPSIPLLALLALAESVLAPHPTHSGPPKIEELPAAFNPADRLIVPRSLDDLREMEEHTAGLIAPLREVTVGIRVGPAFGSGVLISADGLVLTAGHVSGTPGQRAEVTFSNGRRYSAVTLGQNRNIDTGLIRIDGNFSDWPHAEMAPDDSAGIGDWVLAFGHPGGVQAGRDVVVRLGRVIHKQDTFLQSDCELVGGDSGGPMFDMQGRVIAINSRIGRDTDWNLHVPVAKFRQDWDRLLAGQSFIQHSGALLGIDIADAGIGVVVETVYDGSAAADAGIKEGDVVLSFQGERVEDETQLKDLVGLEPPGSRVRIIILRDEDGDGERDFVPVILRLGERKPRRSR